MRITKIHLQNIGVFENTIIEFPEKTDPDTDKAEIHIFTGENGTGKSTILYALASVMDLSPQLSSRFRYNDDRSMLIVGMTDNLFLKYKFDQESAGFVNYHPAGIKAYQNKIKNFQKSHFDFAFFAYSGYRSIGSRQLGAIQELTSNPLDDALNFNNWINPALFMQWVANNKTKEALEFLKNRQGNPKRYNKSIARIERAIAEITGQKIEFVLETDPLSVVTRVEDRVLPFDVLPDGLKAIVSWIADLLMRMDRIKWATDVDVLDRNFVLFLDEIDVHLHPAWQRKILPAVQKLFRNAQIFVSTHSPFVVGSVDGAWVHKLVLDEKGNSHAEPARKTEDGESYQYILREVFGIDKRFGVGAEADLDRFNQLKSGILQKQPVDKKAFLQLARSLADQSTELSTIIGSELRQLSRITQEEFAI